MSRITITFKVSSEPRVVKNDNGKNDNIEFDVLPFSYKGQEISKIIIKFAVIRKEYYHIILERCQRILEGTFEEAASEVFQGTTLSIHSSSLTLLGWEFPEQDFSFKLSDIALEKRAGKLLLKIHEKTLTEQIKIEAIELPINERSRAMVNPTAIERKFIIIGINWGNIDLKKEDNHKVLEVREFIRIEPEKSSANIEISNEGLYTITFSIKEIYKHGNFITLEVEPFYFQNYKIRFINLKHQTPDSLFKKGKFVIKDVNFGTNKTRMGYDGISLDILDNYASVNPVSNFSYEMIIPLIILVFIVMGWWIFKKVKKHFMKKNVISQSKPHT